MHITLNARRTRGGPLTLNPESNSFSFYTYTDGRVWWVLSMGAQTTFGEDESDNSINATLEFKVLPSLTVSFGPEYSKYTSETQWVDNFSDATATNTYGKRYVFAHLDQNTFATNIRADWIISPMLSFQVYLQPFIASGKYTDFKYLAKPKSYDYVKYGEGNSTIEKTISQDGEVTYTLDPDGNGSANPETIDNPDFNYISLRGNAVLRWEYLPGSTLFLVWTQSRQDVDPIGEFQFGKSFKNLFGVRPDNIFMLKITYWL
ncbi:MAG: DUF5916 domain-containing protein [Ignavibacteriaceae bacterium]